ncbi:patatin-like phospholipase family protein [Acetobacteraceae bacterium H6797]|nr:patatin-like phospholipase family protein [Acetobacteraceae bacterium H6797]
MAESVSAPAVNRLSRARLAINLALQGGGTHGAFTWGVVERLLEEEWLEICAISGTSAGAINGAMLAQGLGEGGRQGGIDALDRLWRQLGRALALSPLQNSPFERVLWGPDLSFSFAWQFFEALTRIWSPYQLDPFKLDMNPLRDLLAEQFRRESLALPGAPKLFVSATSVRTGKARVFKSAEISVDALLASACLPQIFKAVEVDGEPFWDGGYLGNPAIWPLYDEKGPPDVVLVQINPLVREDVPMTVMDIMSRLNEIGFNASLMNEMRAIEFVQRLLDEGVLKPPRYHRLFMHLIEDEERMRAFKESTKYNGDWSFLTTLKQYGREAADGWLKANIHRLGQESTVDIKERFL